MNHGVHRVRRKSKELILDRVLNSVYSVTSVVKGVLS